MIRHFNCKARHHSHTGFTLVEVMIAIAIIAILVAVAVPNIISGERSGVEFPESKDGGGQRKCRCNNSIYSRNLY